MIKLHPPRKETAWQMFTVSGKPVYQFGHSKFTLDRAEHRLPTKAYGDDVNSQWSRTRLSRAEEQIGEQCVWRDMGQSEVMDVSF